MQTSSHHKPSLSVKLIWALLAMTTGIINLALGYSVALISNHVALEIFQALIGAGVVMWSIGEMIETKKLYDQAS